MSFPGMKWGRDLQSQRGNGLGEDLLRPGVSWIGSSCLAYLPGLHFPRQALVTTWAQSTLSAPGAFTFCSSIDQWLEASCLPLKEKEPRGIHFRSSLLPLPLFFLQTPHHTPDVIHMTT